MAWLAPDDKFDPDTIDNDVIGIASELAWHDSGMHTHLMGQLLFSQAGCMRITLDDSVYMLPPLRVAWIPPRQPHRVHVSAAVGYRSVYLSDRYAATLPHKVEVLCASRLLSELLERIACAAFDTHWEEGPAARLLAICGDEIAQAPRELTQLPLPSDRRIRALAHADTLPPLHLLAQRVGATEKTISRLFRKDTGLSYQQWRQQWRLIKAIELLARGERQADIAEQLGFSGDSAFITFFKHTVGMPPRAYMAAHYSEPAPKARPH